MAIYFISRNSYFLGLSGKLIKSQQTTTNRNKLQPFLICDKTLQYAHVYGILQLVQVAKESRRDRNGRRNLLYTRGNCQVTEISRRLSNPALTPEENTCLQNQWAMAYRPRRIQSIYGKEQKHSGRGQIEKAGVSQQVSEILTAHLLPRSYQPLGSRLSRTCRLLHMMPYVVRNRQPLYNIWMRCKGWSEGIL